MNLIFNVIIILYFTVSVRESSKAAEFFDTVNVYYNFCEEGRYDEISS